MPDEAAAALGVAAEQAGMRRERTLQLDRLSSRSAPAGTRALGDQPHLELRVAAPGVDEGQVLLEVDGTGVARWHICEPAATGTGTDRAGGEQVFRVPIEQIALPRATAGDRSLAGFGIRKALHLLRYPVQRMAERGGKLAVQWWEDRFRPHRLRLATPDRVLHPVDPPTADVTPDQLARLSGGPLLLLVHGTFSTCGAAFRGLAADPSIMSNLHDRYPGRVLVFDHPTVHLSPEANARWLLDRLPADRRLTLDIVAHSRGGLVARHLARPDLAEDAGRPTPAIRRLVHVGTPNAGTVLASQGRLSSLLDVFTNLLSLLPDQVMGVALEAVVEVVKQIASGVMAGLDGLTAMDPQASGLAALNQTPALAGAKAVTSDFEPGPIPRVMVALDAIVDRMFGGGANDLVVSTDGVHDAGAYQIADLFAVPRASAVSHCRYFHDSAVCKQITAWLP
jgi:hypothetical protein